MAKKDNATVLKVWLYPDQQKWLRDQAKRRDVSLSQIVRELIEVQRGVRQ